MNEHRHFKSSLFLIELMINTFFFAMLIAICLQLFFKAHKLSENATSLHHAITSCTSIAEVYQSDYNGKDVVLAVYPDALALNTTILIYFDEQFLPCTEPDSLYRVILDHTIPSKATITFYAQTDETAIYSLAVSSYVPRTLDILGGISDEQN